MRVDTSSMPHHCFRSDHIQIRYVNRRRELAHEKHGENSIESLDYNNPCWLSILVEEVGEIAHALTYDSQQGPQEVLEEILDVMTVCSAWVDAFREVNMFPDPKGAWVP